MRPWAERFIEKALHVTVYPAPPFGVDPYAQLRHLRAWSSEDVVFDVGANDGRTVLDLQRYLPSPTIYAFEPVSSTFRILEERTRHLDHVRRFPVAVGAAKGRETIYLHEKAILNSFSPQWYSPIGTDEVDVTTVDQVMADEGIDFVHFLKIDTEGHELQVLEGARDALAGSRDAVIQVEVGFDRTVSPHTPLEDVRRYLAQSGYYLHGLFSQRGTSSQVRPPAGWGTDRTDRYRPSLLKLCDAVFIAADVQKQSGHE